MKNCGNCNLQKFYQNFKKYKLELIEQIKILKKYCVYYDLEIKQNIIDALDKIENEKND